MYLPAHFAESASRGAAAPGRDASVRPARDATAPAASTPTACRSSSTPTRPAARACCAPTSRAPTRSGRRRAATSIRWSSSRARRATSRRPGIRARPSTARSCRPGTTSMVQGARPAARDRRRGLAARLRHAPDRPPRGGARAERRGAPVWAVTDAPADYVETMLRAIVGIEIPLSSLVGKWKVSQNRRAADRDGVAAGLAERAGRRRRGRWRAGGARAPGARRDGCGARDARRAIAARGRALRARPAVRRRRRSAAPFEDTMAQRVLACTGCHGPRGPRRARRLLPAHRRQAGRLPVQPAAQLPRRPAPLRADERTCSRRSTTPTCARSPPTSPALDLPYPPPLAPLALGGDCATPARPLVRRRRPGARHAGLHRLPRHGDDRHRAVRPGPARPAARLPQRPARRLAQRQAARAAARLHGAGRADARARGHRRGLGLARGAAGARRREAAPPALATPLPIACGGVTASGAARRAPRRDEASASASASRWPSSAVGRAARARRRRRLAQPARRRRAARARCRGTPPATPSSSRAASTWRAPADCTGCHTERGGAPYAGGRAIETPFGNVYASNLTPDAATGLGSLVGRRVLARPAQRPLARRAPALSGLPVPELHPRVARRCRRDVRLPAEPAAGGASRTGRTRSRFPFDTQAALAVWRALFFRPAASVDDPTALAPSGTAAPTWSRASAIATPATRAQRPRRDAAARSTCRRPDPGAELVRAFARVAARGRRRRLAEARGRAPAQDRRLGARLRAWGR